MKYIGFPRPSYPLAPILEPAIQVPTNYKVTKLPKSIDMKKMFLIFALFIFVMTNSEGRIFDKDARKMVFFIDGVITTDLKKIENGQNNDSLKVVNVYSRNRRALLNCGEKFRNGVVFLESTKNKVK